MPLRVLIAPDKFKGTLTARAAAEAIARGWHQARPKDRLELVPISDGGDGFGQVMSDLMGAVPRTIQTCDAAHRPCKARWWWEPRSRTALIETAEVIGLAKLPANRFHPFELDTYGLGKVVRAVAQCGARRCLVGLGGSATNDGGFGLARALGWEFLNDARKPIERWTELPTATRTTSPPAPFHFPELIAAVDVQNLLLGPRGATRIYGPQKGIRPADFRLAERCLARLVAMVQKATRRDLAHLPGAGAAGGLGFGFAAFLDGSLEPGFQLVAREAALEKRLSRADLVITAEGAIDRSTFMGKGAGCVARLCQEQGVPCMGLAGTIGPGITRNRLFAELKGLTELTGDRQAKREPAKWLQALAKQVAARWCEGGWGLALRRNEGTVSRMNLEDHLGDIIRKARGMSKVSPEAAARAAGATVEDLEKLEDSGRTDKQLNYVALGQAIGLDGAKLEAIAKGWLPTPKDTNIWCEFRCLTSEGNGMAVNNYVIWDEVSREAALFDTGWYAQPVEKLIAENQLQLRHIFITHTHEDHIAALADVRKAFPKARLHSSSKNAPVDQRNRPNDFIHLGSLRITHRDTPGHAEDGTTYIIGTWPEDAPHVAIVGDAIFAGSIGRGNQSWDLARQKVREQILTLPPETLICPGHGPLTTVGEEKAHNPFF